MLKMKVEMLERIITQQEVQLDNYRSQVLLMVSNGKVNSVVKPTIMEIKNDLFDTIGENIKMLSDEDIRCYIENSPPAYSQMIQLLERCINGDKTEGVIMKVMNGGLIKYKKSAEMKQENGNILFDKIFKVVYDRVKVVAEPNDEYEYIKEDVNYVKDKNCYENVIMLTCAKVVCKEKLQKELLKIVKNNAFSNK